MGVTSKRFWSQFAHASSERMMAPGVACFSVSPTSSTAVPDKSNCLSDGSPTYVRHMGPTATASLTHSTMPTSVTKLWHFFCMSIEQLMTLLRIAFASCPMSLHFQVARIASPAQWWWKNKQWIARMFYMWKVRRYISKFKLWSSWPSCLTLIPFVTPFWVLKP